MIFRLMLFDFSVAMKSAFIFASLKDRGFKRRIKDKKFIFQVKMKNSNKGRYYKLEKGKITSKGKISHESPGLLIEWKDSTTALKTLVKTSPKAFYHSMANAVVSGNLAVEIEHAQCHAFFEALREMAGVYAGFIPLIKKIPGTKKLFG